MLCNWVVYVAPAGLFFKLDAHSNFMHLIWEYGILIIANSFRNWLGGDALSGLIRMTEPVLISNF